MHYFDIFIQKQSLKYYLHYIHIEDNAFPDTELVYLFFTLLYFYE